VSSATWQFWVGKSSASTPVDTSNGAILDVNGDGYPDFLVGSHNFTSGVGAGHLYLGSATSGLATWNGTSPTSRIDLTSLEGTGMGVSVASVGDVNGDGYADFLIGPHLYLGSAAPSAAAWNGPSSSDRIDLTSPDGVDANFAVTLASAGDVNGDGYADFLIGAAFAKTNPGLVAEGAAYLYFGSALPTAAAWNGTSPLERIDLASPDGPGGEFGASVASAGDIDGDGFADFLVGAPDANGGTAQGVAHVYLGSATPRTVAWNGSTPTLRIDVASPDGRAGVFGDSVASAGDVNGDGYADFLVGATGMAAEPGMAHMYFGSRTPSATSWNGASASNRIDLTSPDGANAHFGVVSSASDVNGDGYDDFLIGAVGASSNSGAAHIYFGAATLSADVWNGLAPMNRIDLTDPDGTNAALGTSVASAGDVNRDGYADFLVGAYNASGGGAAHLYLGSATPGTTSWNGAAPALKRLDLTNPDGTGAAFGSSVASLDQPGGRSVAMATAPKPSLLAQDHRSRRRPLRLD
jgi:hypothetical protein